MLAGLVIGFIAGQLIGVAALAFCLASRSEHDADQAMLPSHARRGSALGHDDPTSVLARGRAALGLADSAEDRASPIRRPHLPLDHEDTGEAFAYR